MKISRRKALKSIMPKFQNVYHRIALAFWVSAIPYSINRHVFGMIIDHKSETYHVYCLSKIPPNHLIHPHLFYTFRFFEGV